MRGYQSGAPQRDRAVVRDAALARVSRTRRLALVGAAALSAGLAALASALLPGKSFGAGSRGVSSSTSASTAPPLPNPANAAQLGLSASGQTQGLVPQQSTTPQQSTAPQNPAPSPPPPTPAPQPSASTGSAPAATSGGS